MQLTVLSYIFSFCFPLSETFQLSIQVLYMYILVILIRRIDIRTGFALLYSVYFLRLSFIICSVFADFFFGAFLFFIFF